MDPTGKAPPSAGFPRNAPEGTNILYQRTYSPKGITRGPLGSGQKQRNTSSIQPISKTDHYASPRDRLH